MQSAFKNGAGQQLSCPAVTKFIFNFNIERNIIMENFVETLKTFFNLQASIGKKYVEIRFIKTMHGIVSGIFQTTEQCAKSLASEVKRLGLEKCSMYHTINIISDEYVNNYAAQYKMNTLYPKMKKTISDADIRRLRLIMLDFDPKRTSGISSTDDEKS